MERHHAEIEAAGLKVVAVGLGRPAHAQRYCPRLAPSVVCLVGQGSSAHLAYGLRRGGVMQLAGPQVVGSALRAAAQGLRQGQTTGDRALLSGSFVIGQDGAVRAAFYSRHAGDHPDLAEMVRAIGRAEVRA